MKLIRDFFSSTLGFFLVFALSTYVILLSFTNVVLKPAVFLKVLETHQTYEKIATEILPQTILSQALKSSDSNQVDQETINKVAALVDKEKLKPISAQFKKITEDGYLYIIGDKANFEERIDLSNNLTEIRDSVNTGLKKAVAQNLIQSEQASTILQNLTTQQSYILVVTPEKITLVSSSGKLEQPTAAPSNQKFSLKNIREAVVSVNQIQEISLIAVIILTLLLYLSRITDWSSGFKWVGGSYFAAGLFPFILSIVLIIVKPINLVTQFLEKQNLSISQVLLTLTTDNLGDLLNKFLENLRLYSLILLVIAAACYFLAWLINRLRKPKNNPSLDTTVQKT